MRGSSLIGNLTAAYLGTILNIVADIKINDWRFYVIAFPTIIGYGIACILSSKESKNKK